MPLDAFADTLVNSDRQVYFPFLKSSWLSDNLYMFVIAHARVAFEIDQLVSSYFIVSESRCHTGHVIRTEPASGFRRQSAGVGLSKLPAEES